MEHEIWYELSKLCSIRKKNLLGLDACFILLWIAQIWRYWMLIFWANHSKFYSKLYLHKHKLCYRVTYWFQLLSSINRQNTEKLIILIEQNANAINPNILNVKVEKTEVERYRDWVEVRGRGEVKSNVRGLFLSYYLVGNQESLPILDGARI